MVLPSQYSKTTPHWYDQNLPSDPEDMAAFIASHNGTTPMFQPSQSIPGPNGEAGWRMAGNDNPALNHLTPGEYYAQLLNNRATQAGMHPNSPDAKMFQLAMYSRNQVRPEEMQAVYNAAGSGTGGPHPILNDAMLNFLESLGYGPPKSISVSGQKGSERPVMPGDKTTDNGSPRRHDQNVPGYHYEGDILVKDGPNGRGPHIEPWLQSGGGGVPPSGGPNLDPSLFPPGMLTNWLKEKQLQKQMQLAQSGQAGMPPYQITTPPGGFPMNQPPVMPLQQGHQMSNQQMQGAYNNLGQGWYLPPDANGWSDMVARYGPMPSNGIPIQPLGGY